MSNTATPGAGNAGGTKGKKKKEKKDEAQESTSPKADYQGMHPLENEWVLWYDKRPAQTKRIKGEKDNYENNLTLLGKFATVEQFWQYFNHIAPPSSMDYNSNYHLFKEGIKPMWEDANNKHGGKWIVTVKGSGVPVDRLWENAVLAVIGESLDDGDDICGIVFSRRKQSDRIAVWNRSRSDELSIMSIGHKLKAALTLEQRVQIVYQNHEDSLKSGTSYTNPDRFRL